MDFWRSLSLNDPFRSSLPQLPGIHPTTLSCYRKILLAFVGASTHVPV
jgi:hypothetical protein